MLLDYFGREIILNSFFYVFNSRECTQYFLYEENNNVYTVRKVGDLYKLYYLDEVLSEDSILIRVDDRLTYNNFESLDKKIKKYAVLLSELDCRPAHPESYVFESLKLISTKEPQIRFEMVKTLYKNPRCYTKCIHSVLDFVDFVCR